MTRLVRLLAGSLISASLLAGCISSRGNETAANGAAGSSATQSAAAIPSTPQMNRVEPNLFAGYLVNPGIGWQDGPEPFGIMNFPETVAYANRQDISWSILNPGEAEYDWSVLDVQLNEASQRGEQFSFRIYTHVGESFGGSQVPAWVLAKGARLLPSGEPDYSNCIYQEEWGNYVNELIRRYDGNPFIAFIDISGYGNFNEWSWQDTQTKWDAQWESDYAAGTASPASFQTLDGQARRRLADMFIGGTFQGHSCRDTSGAIAQVDYAYPGFRKTQLLMPYAGIVQSSQYVLTRRSDIGLRYDCLGRDGPHVYEKIGPEIERTWPHAPVVFELCKPTETDVEDARWLLHAAHGSLVHNNQWDHSRAELEEMMLPVGYRYALAELEYALQGRQITASMKWKNVGLAPSYPRMGQDFQLYFCLVDGAGRIVLQDPVSAEIAAWLPAGSDQNEAPVYDIPYTHELPSSFPAGKYQAGVAILDLRMAVPIQLAMDGRDANGVYLLFQVEVR